MESFINEFIQFSRTIYEEDYIPLHRPVFEGNEKLYLNECIDSNFVSSVGKRVVEFEKKIQEYTGCKYAIATVNGTSALHVALHLSNVKRGDEIITQALTFVATCNAISYIGASPVFIDVDIDTLGMSPRALEDFLQNNAKKTKGKTINKFSGKKISACIPMHTFGHPCKIEEIKIICDEWGIELIEDTAESLGSFVKNIHTGNFGKMSALSFNGNKMITTGGGGMLLTNDIELAKRAKHITTTSKVSHPYEFIHDEIGFNYRMPNLNAALGCAQIEHINSMIDIKANIAKKWKSFFEHYDYIFFESDKSNKPNNWLNVVFLNNKTELHDFLIKTNKKGVMTRPIWRLMSQLSMFSKFQNDGLKNSLWLQDRVVNIPSSVPNKDIIKLDM